LEIASAPLTSDELDRLMRLLPTTRVFFQYGSTECSRAFILDTTTHPDKLHTVGLPTPGVEVRVRGSHGEWLEPGGEGEVLLTAPQLTHGYWQRPELNAQRLEDGWLRTGDFGCVDDKGFLTLRGRQDEMINCGGHSYFPAEVEVELGTVAGVSRYLIAGVPDPQGILTQVGWAFVVPEHPDAWSVTDFLRLARQRLPGHMLPRNIVVVPSIPLTPSGKPSRRMAVEMYGPTQQDS
jgi:acyl-CoA synthetase (AMP-forming)/AMP-acid ligase II